MSHAGAYYDELETRDPAAREAALLAALPGQVDCAKARAPAFARILSGVDPAAVTSRAVLARLPVTRKSDLIALQAAAPPLGGLSALAPGTAARLFASPGPIYEPEGPGADFWRLARALHAAGFRVGDVVHNTFSYHLTPGGWMVDAGLRALGCTVVPAGVGNTEGQARAVAHLRPSGFAGTPDFLKVLLDTGAALGLDCGSIVKALVSGGALFPSLRRDYAERGIAVLQCYATADVGLIAYETRPDEGMVLDEGIVVELVHPGTGDPVAEGEVGEVVVTTLNPDYPLIRFATGDLSAVLPGGSACGRTNVRLKGWLGRADQVTKVKGMFVHPAQVSQVIGRHPAVLRARLVVGREGATDVMTLRCEVPPETLGDEALRRAVEDSLQSVTRLRGQATLEPPGALPEDGKIIEDARRYE